MPYISVKHWFPVQRRSGGSSQQLLIHFSLLFTASVIRVWANHSSNQTGAPSQMYSSQSTTALPGAFTKTLDSHGNNVFCISLQLFCAENKGTGCCLLPGILLSELQELWTFRLNLAFTVECKSIKQELKCMFGTCWGIAYSYIKVSFYFTQ